MAKYWMWQRRDRGVGLRSLTMLMAASLYQWDRAGEPESNAAGILDDLGGGDSVDKLRLNGGGDRGSMHFGLKAGIHDKAGTNISKL